MWYLVWAIVLGLNVKFHLQGLVQVLLQITRIVVCDQQAAGWVRRQPLDVAKEWKLHSQPQASLCIPKLSLGQASSMTPWRMQVAENI